MILPMRRDALRARDAWRRHLVATDERILAHLDGVRAVGDRSVLHIAALTSGDDPAAIEAGTLALAALNTSLALEEIATVWEADTAVSIPAVGSALLLIAPAAILDFLGAQRHQGSALRRVIGDRVLMRRGRAATHADALAPLLTHDEPAVRVHTWHLVMEAGRVLGPREYAAAMRDAEGSVRDAALLAAAWAGVQGALAIARAKAEHPDPADPLPLRLLSVLGERDDLRTVSALANHQALGPLRLELAGLYGSPSHIPMLIDAMAPDDPRRAIVACQAFARMTGVDVSSTERVFFPREGVDPADEFANEFQDEGLLPDPAQATAVWAAIAPAVGSARRICWGAIADEPSAIGAPSGADLETHWWHLVRSRFWRVSAVSFESVERFPAR